MDSQLVGAHTRGPWDLLWTLHAQLAFNRAYSMTKGAEVQHTATRTDPGAPSSPNKVRVQTLEGLQTVQSRVCLQSLDSKVGDVCRRGSLR